MAGSTIGSFIIMFFALLIMVSSVFMIYTSALQNTSAISEQQQENEKRLATSISIVNVTVDELATPDKTIVHVTNDGNRKLATNDVDIYFDGELIPRSADNRSIGFYSENVVNPLQWDPGEILEINITNDVENETHRIVVATEFAVKDSTIFTHGS